VSDIVDFITARLDEIEAVAADPHAARLWAPGTRQDGVVVALAPFAVLDGELHASPTYVLDDIAAKRRIVQRLEPIATWVPGADIEVKLAVTILADFASVWSDHPDWREEWQPPQ
jgi:hypothetical protein